MTPRRDGPPPTSTPLTSASTPAEPSALSLRLDELPGLDAVGLRVPLRGETTGIVLRPGEVWLETWREDVDWADWALDGGRVLDLADGATRDRVARWCASRLGWTLGDSTAPSWERSWDVDELGAVGGARGWSLVASGGRHVFVAATDDRDPATLVVPALAGIDRPDDERRLSDGSLWCSAAALAAFARHLGAGGAR